MDRLLSKKKVSDYLKGIVQKNADLVHYVGTNKEELTNLIHSKAGITGPVLNFYGYRWKLEGNSQRTFNARVVSFAVLIAGVDIEDYQAQDEAVSSAEAIGLEVLSYIYQEAQLPETGWLYNNLTKESITADEIAMRDTAALFGMDFSFELKVSEPLVVNKTKWTDGNKFC